MDLKGDEVARVLKCCLKIVRVLPLTFTWIVLGQCNRTFDFVVAKIFWNRLYRPYIDAIGPVWGLSLGSFCFKSNHKLPSALVSHQSHNGARWGVLCDK